MYHTVQRLSTFTIYGLNCFLMTGTNFLDLQHVLFDQWYIPEQIRKISSVHEILQNIFDDICT